MIEPLVRVPRRRRSAGMLGPAAMSEGSLLALPSGEIAGDFRPLDVPIRRRRAAYELLVANDTPLPLRAFTYAVEGRHSARLVWNSIVVEPHSAVALMIEIKLPRDGRTPRVVAEIHATDAQLTLDAGNPQRPRRRRPFRPWTVAAGLVLLIGAGASLAFGRPRVMALAAPDAVRGGTSFSVAYALADSGDAEYVVESPDGVQVRRGALRSDTGAFTLDLPAATVSSGYDVRVVAHGPFGSTSRSTHVVALPPPAPAPTAAAPPSANARVAAMSLVRDQVDGGQPIVVDYRTSANDGSVRLIDELGTVRAEAMLNHRGRSILVAPQVDVDQDLRVVVSAQRGTSHDEAAAPIRILRTPPPATPAPIADAASAPVLDGSAPFAVDPVVDVGSPITVRILRREPALHIALIDGTGTELDDKAAPPQATSVTFAPPAGYTTGQLSILGTYANGFVQETVIRPVVLRARANL